MNLSISQRLSLLSGIAILALIGLALVSSFAVRAPRDSLLGFQTELAPKTALLNDVERNFLTARRALLMHIVELYDEKKREDEAVIRQAREAIDQHLASLQQTMQPGTPEQTQLADTQRLLREYDQFIEETYVFSRNYDVDSARELIASKGAALGNQISAAMDTLRRHHDTYALSAQQSAVSTADKLLYIVWGASLLAVIICASLGWLLIHSIRQALHDMQSAVSHIGQHLDFTRRVKATRNDELGSTARVLNQLLDKLQGSLRSIADGATTLASAATQMSDSAGQLAQTSQQQSDAASHMAVTVEEMTVSVNHVADRAQETSQLSSQSHTLATSGEAVIERTVRAIHDIASTVQQAAAQIETLEQRGNEIASVVAVIKEVADQTNLLALNAAIEAARAGEQGRGFAVVADEVRKLAERTGRSTQEITTTINNMLSDASNAVACMHTAVARVSAGVGSAEEASQAIQHIQQGSQQTRQRAEEIASEIREQGAAANSIATQIERIAQMTEAASATASQSASAASELDALARRMQATVAAYRLN